MKFLQKYPEIVVGILFVLLCLAGCVELDKLAKSTTQPNSPLPALAHDVGGAVGVAYPFAGMIIDAVVGGLVVLAGAYVKIRGKQNTIDNLQTGLEAIAKTSTIASDTLSALHPNVQATVMAQNPTLAPPQVK